MSLTVSVLARHHDRNDFDCGKPAHNVFLQRLARQQSERDFSRTYVATRAHESTDESSIRGFYAISAASIDFQNWPPHLKLPRYPVSVARMGRLAVDLREQGRGVGAALLLHAVNLSLSLAQQIGLHALIVDAKSESAAAYYARFGFQRFSDQTLCVFLTTDVIRRAQHCTDQSGAQH